MYTFDISHFANKWKRDCICLSIVDVFAGVTQFFSLWRLSRFVTKLFVCFKEKCREYSIQLCVVFVDYEKAFDSVQTQAILTSLQEQGIEDVYIE